MPKLDISSIDRVIGARIKAEREAHNLTLGDVASQLEITLQMLHRHEKGRARMYVKRLAQIAVIFNRSVGYFLRDAYIESRMADEQDRKDSHRSSKRARTRRVSRDAGRRVSR